MQHFHGIESLGAVRFQHPVVTWGIFDGVHRGHQKILSELVAWAHKVHGEAVCLTFDPHPRVVLEHKSVPFIISLDHRLLLLGRHGVDATFVINFTRGFANQSAELFFNTHLVGRLGVRGILLGEGASFGKGRMGNPEYLRTVAASLGIEVRTSAPLVYEGSVISSSAIRREITAGNLARAAAMLGRPVVVLGTVVSGVGRGRTIGFPTANLDLHHEARPPAGVYGTRARVADRSYLALTNIGVAPTFAADQAHPAERVEVHLLDFDGSLYGTDLEVQFLFRIRAERRFDGVEALVAQLRRDREFLLANAPPPETH